MITFDDYLFLKLTDEQLFEILVEARKHVSQETLTRVYISAKLIYKPKEGVEEPYKQKIIYRDRKICVEEQEDYEYLGLKVQLSINNYYNNIFKTIDLQEYYK